MPSDTQRREPEIWHTVSLHIICVHITCILTRAPRGYSAERAPRGGGGGQILPLVSTSERRVVERRGKQQTKGLNETDLKSIKHFAEVCHKLGRGQVNGQN